MERIFVSSTCYDLLDLRAELEDHLRDLGLTPVMSDRPTSDFQVVPTADSIETCLVNVRGSDAVICILSQRYGPSLKAAGFDDVSATHLEWLEARKHHKPIYMYVRDRTEAEHSLWKKNPTLKTTWVKDQEVFRLLDEHSKLVKDPPDTNWFWTFGDSIDLKRRVAADFAGVSLRATLKRLLEAGLLPAVTAAPGTRRGGRPGAIEVGLCFANRSAVPALEVALVEPPSDRHIGDLAIGQEVTKTFHWVLAADDLVFERPIVVEYRTDRGHMIRDEFLFRYDTKVEYGMTVTLVRKQLLGGSRFQIG